MTRKKKTTTAEDGAIIDDPTQAAKYRTYPLDLTPVPNYPKKLVIYRLAASPFWWVRYYANGKTLRRTTKTANKRDAIEFAKGFYDEVNFKQRQGLVLNSRATDSPKDWTDSECKPYKLCRPPPDSLKQRAGTDAAVRRI